MLDNMRKSHDTALLKADYDLSIVQEKDLHIFTKIAIKRLPQEHGILSELVSILLNCISLQKNIFKNTPVIINKIKITDSRLFYHFWLLTWHNGGTVDGYLSPLFHTL